MCALRSFGFDGDILFYGRDTRGDTCYVFVWKCTYNGRTIRASTFYSSASYIGEFRNLDDGYVQSELR